MFVKSYIKMNKKMEYYYGPYDNIKRVKDPVSVQFSQAKKEKRLKDKSSKSIETSDLVITPTSKA